MFPYRCFAIAATLSMLAACAPPGGGRNEFTPTTAARARSWFRATAQQSTLLYVSNAGGVTVYAMTGNDAFTLVGELFGFQAPAGECTDSRGDVFITDEAARTIVEYGHGSITPKAIIPDDYGSPLSCAVDRTSGSIAVANYSDASGGEPGNVAVYAGPSGPATLYSDPRINEPLYCAFDRKGNLFVDGYTESFHGVLGELRKGAQSLTVLTVMGGTVNLPGWVQTKGLQLLMGDLYDPKTSIYQLSVSGSTATVVGKIALSKTQTLAQFLLFGSGSAAVILAPDNDYNNLEIYSYPGGAPLGSLTDGINQPIGTAISE